MRTLCRSENSAQRGGGYGQGDVEKVKCSLPPTISVPYPTVTAVNTDLYRAAAYGAAAGSYAGYGCGYGNGFFG